MKSFAELFKKYRLRAEFETFTSFGNALAEKGYYYEDSIFSHWQKGSRVPSSRHLTLKIIEIFAERYAIKTITEANELLDSAGMGYLTEQEKRDLRLKNHVAPFQVPSEIVHFVGREEILKQIEEEIFVQKKILLYGSAGVGKTAIAIKLGHHLKEQFPDGVLWYKVDSSNVMEILLSIAYLFGEDISTIKSAQVRASIVRTLLVNKKVLFIFDNVTTDNNISLLLPNTSTCSVILTSQENFRTMASHYRAIKIPPFTEKELLGLFGVIFDKKYVDKYKKIIIQIGDKLGNLPLATHISAHIIAKYSKNYHSSINKYLQQLDVESIDLKTLRYEDKNLFKATTIAFNTLDEKAKSVFISLGVFEGKDFSVDAAGAINGLSHQQIESYFLQLRRISFIQQVGNNRYSMHPLLRVFARQNIRDSALYLKAAKYYEKFVANYQKNGSNIYPQIRQETDNIIYIFKKCYEFQYWDPITNLWNSLEHVLRYTKEADKLRSLAENVHEAKKINVFQKILISYVILHMIFWLILNVGALKFNFLWDYFNFSLSVIPFFGGIAGMMIARSWGFFKNSLGKALTCIAGGLLFWASANLIGTIYDVITKKIHPYPWWGDPFFLISFYLWAVGILLLSQAVGTRYSVSNKQGKRVFIIGTTTVVTISAIIIGFFTKYYGLLEPSIFSLKVILNISYAFSLITMLASALVTFSLSFGFFGGRYKVPMYSLFAGFVFIFLSVVVYYPLIVTKEYYSGNFGDLLYSIAVALIGFGVFGFYRPKKYF